LEKEYFQNEYTMVLEQRVIFEWKPVKCLNYEGQ